MKAIRIHSYGDSEQLSVEDVPKPEVASGKLLVRVRDAGVNPVDWKKREGYMKGVSAHFPMTLGQDFAGEVVEVGESVRGFAPGDRVFGFASGAYAEYALVSPDRIARLPESIDFETAASIPTAGLTAWQALTDAARLTENQTILIQGAAGGVGSFAVQMAIWKGARVIATAAAEDRDYLLSLGVERVIDYKTENFEDDVEDIDAVLDLVGGLTLQRSYQVLKSRGVLVTTVGPVNQDEARWYDIEVIQFVMTPDAEGLAQIADLVDRDIVKPRVSHVMGLEEARIAQDLNQAGQSHGKIILRVN